MSTPTLDQYQESIRSALSSYPYFAGLQVVADTGKNEKAEEVAMRTKGAVILVSQFLSLRRSEDARRQLNCTASYAVHIRTNPDVNLNGTTGAGLNLQAAVEHCIRAVITAHRDPSGTREYVRAAGSLAEIVPDDSGLLTYSVIFEASVQIDV